MIGFLSAKVWASIIGVGVLAAAGWFVVHTIERAALAEAETEGYKIALETQNKRVIDYELRLQDRQEQVRAINHELSIWKQKWKNIQHQPDVAEWVNTPVPSSVRERVLELIEPPGDSGTDWETFIESNALASLF